MKEKGKERKKRHEETKDRQIDKQKKKAVPKVMIEKWENDRKNTILNKKQRRKN